MSQTSVYISEAETTIQRHVSCLSTIPTCSLGQVRLASPHDTEGPVHGAQVEEDVPEEGTLHRPERTDDSDRTDHNRRHEHASTCKHVTNMPAPANTSRTCQHMQTRHEHVSTCKHVTNMSAPANTSRTCQHMQTRHEHTSTCKHVTNMLAPANTSRTSQHLQTRHGHVST